MTEEATSDMEFTLHGDIDDGVLQWHTDGYRAVFHGMPHGLSPGQYHVVFTHVEQKDGETILHYNYAGRK